VRSDASESGSAWVLFAAVLLCGCAASDAMVEVLTPLPELPAAGTAVVVFVRPSTYAEAVRFPILDHTGRFLGHSLPATWFFAQLPAGSYVFYAQGENTAAVRALLAPGRTYFVEVGPKLGWLRPRVELLPIAPRFPSWAKREEWIAESVAHRLEHPDASDLDSSDVGEILERGRVTLEGYDGVELDRRTLRAGDGL
jgi:hypothetical protein